MAKDQEPALPNPLEQTVTPLMEAEFYEFDVCVTELANAGRPYTLRELLEDHPELAERRGARAQISPAELDLHVGTVAMVYEDPAKGERVRAIKYDTRGIIWANSGYRPDNAPKSLAVLEVQKTSDKATLKADLKVLDNETIQIMGEAWLSLPRRLHVRARQMREFASRWGLEKEWDKYFSAQKGDEAGLRQPFVTADPNSVRRSLQVLQIALNSPF